MSHKLNTLNDFNRKIIENKFQNHIFNFYEYKEETEIYFFSKKTNLLVGVVSTVSSGREPQPRSLEEIIALVNDFIK